MEFDTISLLSFTSKKAMEALQEESINWWRTPAESPDLNPIEIVWYMMKQHLRQHIKPTTLDELVAGIHAFWTEVLTIEKCNNLINHVHSVLPIVIEQQGASSGK